MGEEWVLGELPFPRAVSRVRGEADRRDRAPGPQPDPLAPSLLTQKTVSLKPKAFITVPANSTCASNSESEQSARSTLISLLKGR